jgi:mannose-6-phosphate isomerase-like protein (cupin superfamily)
MRSAMNIPGITIHERATGDATGGAFDLTEYIVSPYFQGPPFQQHDQASAACYMLDGLLGFTLGTRTITAIQGACILIPPGTAYTFFNPTASPATFLLWRTPSRWRVTVCHQ